jgi:hypothetical protein
LGELRSNVRPCPTTTTTTSFHAHGDHVPISPSIYWWHAGSFELLPSELNGGTMAFRPPDTFVEMLNRLAAAPTHH